MSAGATTLLQSSRCRTLRGVQPGFDEQLNMRPVATSAGITAGFAAAAGMLRNLTSTPHPCSPCCLQEMSRSQVAADLAPEPATAPSWQRELRQHDMRQQSERQLAVLEEEAPGRLRLPQRAWSIAY